ncbi:MAG: sensor histidine kinase, partial [Planctomycetaceae bacterium]
MRGHTDSISLTRRLIDRYLMFGLGGLFLCLAVSLVLAWRGTLTTLAPMAALPALAVLVAGILALWRTTRLNSEIEGQLRRIAGVSSAAEFSLQPLGATEPAAIGWNHLIEKLADRRALAELEERLAASVGGLKQESLRQALHSLSDGIALADAEGTITLANNAFAALLAGPNARADAVEGTGIQTLLGPMHTRDVETLSTRLRDSLGEVVAEVRRSTDPADGVLRLSRAPLLGDGEQRRRFVWTVRDVTQQKLAENMRNEFVFTATHELRTPLANIKAYAETLALQDDIDVERQKEFCNVINSEATRLARFVDELLNISRMEAGSLSLARHETDVERLLKEVVEHVMPQMDQKQ